MGGICAVSVCREAAATMAMAAQEVWSFYMVQTQKKSDGITKSRPSWDGASQRLFCVDNAEGPNCAGPFSPGLFWTLLMLFLVRLVY